MNTLLKNILDYQFKIWFCQYENEKSQSVIPQWLLMENTILHEATKLWCKVNEMSKNFEKKNHFPLLILLIHQNFSANITWWSLLARESWLTWDGRRKYKDVIFYECNITVDYESDSSIMNLVNLKAFIIKAQHKNFGRF